MFKKDLIATILRTLALVLGIAGAPLAFATHFPWDQGHDRTNWNNPTPPGPCQASTCDPCNSTGSPVYIPTGHLIWSDTDITLKGRPYLGVVRTYNSHDPRDGLFGNGWTAGCDVGLYTSTTGGETKYVLRAANGKRYEYVRGNDGKVIPPPGRFEQVLPQTDGTLHLLYLDNRREIFRADGQLSASLDANANRINYGYDGADRLLNVSDMNGRSFAFTYNGVGRVSHVSDQTGRTWRYDYDLNGNLLSVTDPLGGVRRYEYQSYTPVGDGHTYQHLTKVTDPSGVVVSDVTYNGERVATYTDGQDRYTYGYNTSTKTVTKTDSVGSRWTFVYNDQGLIPRKVDPRGSTVIRVFDVNGRATSTTDPTARVWTATYDNLGRTLTRTNPLGETTQFEYSGTNPAPVSITSPTGRVTRIAYDANQNPIMVTDPAGAVTRFEWNAAGDLVERVDALGNRDTFTYSPIGLLLSASDALSRTKRWSYDVLGRSVAVQNPVGEVTRFTYDTLDRIEQVVDPLGQTTVFVYDPAGRLTELTDARGSATTFTYDGFGRLANETAPAGRITQYGYRADNLPAQVTMPDLRTVSYAYDAAKRITQENAGGEVIRYAYSARGELTSAVGPGGSLSFTYDAAGRLIQDVSNGKTLQRTFSGEGERLSLAALGATTTYGRDTRGLVSSISSVAGTFGLSYDALGRRTGLTFPNAAVATYRFDAAGQLASIGHSGPFTTTYAYSFDAAGRIVRQSGDGPDWTYAYDAAGRLVGANHGAESFAYSYDAAGNILGSGRIYDVANRLTEDAEFSYAYDANGNLTRKQSKGTGARTLYAWNAKSQLLRVERFADAAATTPLKTLVFTYDPLGRRASKTEDGVIERYVYDGVDLIATLNSVGNVVKSFTFGPGIDQPLAKEQSGQAQSYHSNHLGSIMATTSAAGVASQYQYDPYGKTTVTGDGSNPFRYTAREQDAQDLYYYRARYYDPMMERFVSEDPLGLAAGPHLYAYVLGNPVRYTDPLGEIGGEDIVRWVPDWVWTGPADEVRRKTDEEVRKKFPNADDKTREAIVDEIIAAAAARPKGKKKCPPGGLEGAAGRPPVAGGVPGAWAGRPTLPKRGDRTRDQPERPYEPGG